MVSCKLQLLISYKPAEVRQPTKSRSDEIRTLKKNWREKMLETISVFRKKESIEYRRRYTEPPKSGFNDLKNVQNPNGKPDEIRDSSLYLSQILRKCQNLKPPFQDFQIRDTKGGGVNFIPLVPDQARRSRTKD